MRLFAAVVMLVLLFGALGAGAAGSCTCDGRALCIKGEAGAGLAAALKQRVTLELRSSGTNRQISDELSRITGRRIVVLPSKPDEPVNVDIKSAPLWDVLEMFSARGLVTIEGRDFSELQNVRRALAGGGKISVCINRAPLGRVIEELSGLSGQPLRVTSGDEKALVTLSAKAITLRVILSRLSAGPARRSARSNRFGMGVISLRPFSWHARLLGGGGLCRSKPPRCQGRGRGGHAEIKQGRAWGELVSRQHARFGEAGWACGRRVADEAMRRRVAAAH